MKNFILFIKSFGIYELELKGFKSWNNNTAVKAKDPERGQRRTTNSDSHILNHSVIVQLGDDSFSLSCHAKEGSLVSVRGRRGGLMVSALDSGSNGPGSSPGRGHCVVFLSKALNSHSASLHPGV